MKTKCNECGKLLIYPNGFWFEEDNEAYYEDCYGGDC
jgi:hypothetical protein